MEDSALAQRQLLQSKSLQSKLLHTEPLYTELRSAIEQIGPMVVAFSGGVDSSLLAVAAHQVLGDDMIAVTADSASLATGELEQCEQLATEWSLPWQAVATAEMADKRYVANNTDRCFWCKTALMDQLEPIAERRNATVTLGVNVDDLGDHRPGQDAAAERGAQFPLVQAGITKSEVRRLAKSVGLPLWDRPAMPCLSSRLPYGTEVSIPLLSRIDRAESALRSLGFEDVRVRHYGDTARIEVPGDRMHQAIELAASMVERVTAAGYKYVTLDLAGLRSGNLNDGHVTTPRTSTPDQTKNPENTK